MPIILIFFLIVIGVIIMIASASVKKCAKTFEVFSNLAAKYRGQAPAIGKFIIPTLTVPVNGNKATIRYILMYKATGTQIGANTLTFAITSESLRQSVDLVIYTKGGWRDSIKEIGMEKYLTHDSIFDEKFVVNKKGANSKIEIFLNQDLQGKIINIKENTELLEILKKGPRLFITYRKYTIENVDEVDSILRKFIDIYNAFAKKCL